MKRILPQSPMKRILRTATMPLLLLFLLLAQVAVAQSNDGKIKGRVLDADSKEPIGYAQVGLIQNNVVVKGTFTEDDGTFIIPNLSPGTYTVKVVNAGFTKEITGVVVVSGSTADLKDVMLTQNTEGETVVIEEYKEPLIKPDVTSTTVSKEQIKETGIRNVNDLAGLTPKVFTADNNSSTPSIGGSRSTGTTYFVDGVKVRGLLGLGQNSIDQLTVITGGTPAEYGDVMGGIISITTSAPSAQFNGGLELVTSEFLDGYGYNLGSLYFSGPIITKKDSSGNIQRSILGYFVNLEAEMQRDPNPSAIGIFMLNEDSLASLENRPLVLREDGNLFISRANYIDDSYVVNNKTRVDANDNRYRGNVRLDFMPSQNVFIKSGVNLEYVDSKQWGLGNSMFAPYGNQVFNGTQGRGWVRFQQIFDNSGSGKRIRNLTYTLQADYNVYYRNFWDREYKDNPFKYGYVGNFQFDYEPFYTYLNPGDAGHDSTISPDGYYVTTGYRPGQINYDGTYSNNPLMSNYNEQFFDFIYSSANNNGLLRFYDQIETNNLDYLNFFGGIRNGDSPDGIYGLYSGPGSRTGSYTKFVYEQYRLTGQLSLLLAGKKSNTDDPTSNRGFHNIKAGFEIESRTERFYSVAARALWSYMRQLANQHIFVDPLDPTTRTPVYFGSTFGDTLKVAPSSNGTPTYFSQQLRKSLGLDPMGASYINIDGMSPDQFDLSMFSANELLNNGNSYVGYYGFDYTGKKTKKVSAEQFFNDTINRPMNVFNPTYISGFIQDQFELENITFNIGVRVDRFDANQKVLKDLYSLYPTYTASEAAGLLGASLPSGVDGDWVPYVDNVDNPTQIVGYRDGDKWYDANGAPISSASLRQSSGKVQPYIKAKEVNIESFQDYKPQTIVMPRLSFSFPINKDAVFYAHYDVLAQRPGQTGSTSGSLLAGQLSDYYFLASNPTVDVTNPSLKPEKTIDYEVGFEQALNEDFALNVSAYYREMRDMIQFQQFIDAYPINYSSYNNLDFGTVKGFTVGLEMRRSEKIPVRFNASYTLQFATGTGSNFSSSRSAVGSLDGFSVIRTLLPLDFDQRHRFTGNIDLRWFDQPGHMGPGFGGDSVKKFYPLKNFGINSTVYLGSGTPYSRRSDPSSGVISGQVNGNQLMGTPNGSRLPWQYRLDLKVDKTFNVGGKDQFNEDGTFDKKSHEYGINVYVLIYNVLDRRNILAVYQTSGRPDDDGYLSTSVGQQTVDRQISPTSFSYLYGLRVQSPFNYSLPRRIRLGVQLFF